jgi:hypothetical protein
VKLEASTHSITGATMFELRTDFGVLVAGIYATENGLKIVSKYVVNHPLLVAIEPHPLPPAIVIDLAEGMRQWFEASEGERGRGSTDERPS